MKTEWPVWETKSDFWVQCKESWVRWSTVVAITVATANTKDYEVVLVTPEGRSWPYRTVETKEDGMLVIQKMLEQFSGHYG